MGLILLATDACDRAPKPDVPHAVPTDTATTSAKPAAKARPEILFIGTSLTAGLGLEPARAYPSVVARRLDSLGESYEVVNAGVSGETSADARRRLGWLLRRPAAVIVLETGANDGLRGLSVEAMRANIQAIIDTIRTTDPKARLVLAAMEAPPNMSERYTADFRKVFRDLARKNGITYMPFFLAGIAGVDSLNQADGIHPNTRGAELAAANVVRTLKPILDSLDKAR